MVGLMYLIRVSIGPHIVEWVTVLVITGVGMGIAIQYPFVAIYTILEGDDRFTGISERYSPLRASRLTFFDSDYDMFLASRRVSFNKEQRQIHSIIYSKETN
jgi:hypothetical protein